MKTLSEKQKQILKYISQCTIDQGYPPSVREIGKEVGLSSPSTVHAHLKTLRELVPAAAVTVIRKEGGRQDQGV